ncbi:hypothetical protein [Cognatiyoonia sp. IB215182]|uniref:hypothetical protein n=1 Tax=Cognatiyoonia sp. IB215182 TaxID=3097353 RepID=UPI002A10CD86|nr:hypothetical protein [Cognatiyoonia sp. IB215182]MDX8355536.1 hypothetical protein [Cognatiyoonia sp. IB215182]
MLLEIENRKPTHVKEFAVVEQALRGLQKSGPHSFAILTAQDGSYLQVAGGESTCVIELRSRNGGKHYRAYSKKRHRTEKDLQTLVFGGGKMRVEADELLELEEAIIAFSAFFRKGGFPDQFGWRDISEMFD